MNDDIGFRTIPALFTPDADTTLVFLSGNGVEYFEEINDPWYHATVPGDNITVTDNDGIHMTVYQPDEAASSMGCTEQFQYCNPSLPKNKCGPLASSLDSRAEAAPLFGMSKTDFVSAGLLNEAMISRYQWLITLVTAAVSTNTIVNTLGPDSLLSPKYLLGGLMGSLPDDQWQLDVQNWWAIFLASLQAEVVETARGSADSALDPYKELPYNSHIRSMCNNQVRCLPRAYFFFSQKLIQAHRIIEDPQYETRILQPLRAVLHFHRRHSHHNHILRYGAHLQVPLQSTKIPRVHIPRMDCI